MLLVDDDEAELGIGQEQCRPRADDDPRRAARHGAPRATAFRRVQVGVPECRPRAEPRLEPLQPAGGQRDLREQDQRLPPPAQRRRDSLQIDFRLPGTRNAVDHRDVESVLGDTRVQRRDRVCLAAREPDPRPRGVRRFESPVLRRDDSLERGVVRKAPDHRGAHGGGFAYVRERAWRAVRQQVDNPPPGLGHPRRRRAGEPIGDAAGGGAVGGGLEEGPRAHDHAEYGAGGRQRVGRDPLDERADVRGQRGQVVTFRHLAELPGLHTPVARPPHHAVHIPGT